MYLIPLVLLAASASAQDVVLNAKEDGYRGIWYFNQASNDEYVYKYSGGLGTYCANHIPFAVYAPAVDKTFFCWGGRPADRNTLFHMVSYYDHKTGLVPRPTCLLDKHTDDAHDNPVIALDRDGYVWVFSSSHGRGRPSYVSRSTAPYAVDQFELVWTGNFSYPQPWPLGDRRWLFMHTFYDPGRTIAMTTSPDGVTWSERRLVASIEEGHYQISAAYGAAKVGTAFNHHPLGKGLNWRTNLYYIESDDLGATWKTAAGEVLAIPLTTKDTPARVHDYAHDGLLVYTVDITFDGQGRPVILYITSRGYQSGPGNGPRTWTTARWNGAEWEIRPSGIVSDSNYDVGALYVEADGTWRIIGPTETGPQPYNPGGEVAMWTSGDQGAHWTRTRTLTAHSEYNHTYVRRPVNAHPGFYAFWADGHARQPSGSRLYFCTKDGEVFRLPPRMDGDLAKPELVPGP